MKRLIALAWALILIGTIFLLSKSVDANEYDREKKLYSTHCQICHGIKGDGNGPAAVTLSPPPADFTKPSFWQNDVDKKITETILHGHGPMPAFNLKSEEIKAIINYMFHTFKRDEGK